MSLRAIEAVIRTMKAGVVLLSFSAFAMSCGQSEPEPDLPALPSGPTIGVGGKDWKIEAVAQGAVESKEGMVDPIVAWTPSPGTSGLAFYTGDRFPQWKNNLFSGGLASRDVCRVVLTADGKVQEEERLRIGRRVRDVRQGPDGYLYLLTDEQDGELLRLMPK